MKKRHLDGQILQALRHFGPMADGRLVKILGVLGYNPGSVKKHRRELFRRKLIRRAPLVLVDRRGNLSQVWELGDGQPNRTPANALRLRPAAHRAHHPPPGEDERLLPLFPEPANCEDLRG